MRRFLTTLFAASIALPAMAGARLSEDSVERSRDGDAGPETDDSGQRVRPGRQHGGDDNRQAAPDMGRPQREERAAPREERSAPREQPRFERRSDDNGGGFERTRRQRDDGGRVASAPPPAAPAPAPAPYVAQQRSGGGFGGALERAIERNQADNRRDAERRDARRRDDSRQSWDRDGRQRRDWSRNWRDDRRYDWRSYRDRNRVVFQVSRYYDPYGSRYRRTMVGWNMRPSYYSQAYWIQDPWMYRLPQAYGPYQWVRYYDDALLVDTFSGQVVDVLYNFFW